VNEFGTVRNKKTRELKRIFYRSGYLFINIYSKKKKKAKNYSIHFIVARTFIGKRLKGLVIDHKDGNKFNNYFKNLEYITYSENSKRAFELDLSKPMRGSNHPLSKLIENDVLNIRKLFQKGKTRKYLAHKYNISYCLIASLPSTASKVSFASPFVLITSCNMERIKGASSTMRIVFDFQEANGLRLGFIIF